MALGIDARVERCLAILFATEIAAQSLDISWLIFAHRWMGIGTNQDNAIAAKTDKEHQNTR